jgi:diguanylate cyclase (GGDEF)-like protein
LIVLDLDEFKRVNDSLGHQAGDHILKAFGDAVADQLPDAATLYRWGGEEFAILAFMQGTDAKVLAESLRRHIEKMVLPLDVHITASFGVTEILPVESVDAAFQRADAALYEAKHAGRNRSVFRAP